MIRKPFNIGLIQLDTGSSRQESLQQLEAFLKEAKEQGAELVILPEHSDVIARGDGEEVFPVPGPVSTLFGNLAKKYHLYLHCGSIYEADRKEEGEKAFNTSLLFSPEGELVQTYRKMHLFDVTLPDGTSVRESDRVAAGSSIAAADTELCRIGMTICYDLRFPELYRLLALEGADLLVVSANFTAATGRDHWETLLRARAIENGCYVAAVNQCGEKPLFKAWGHTMLIDPWGTVLGELSGEHPGLLMGRVDPEQLKRTREKLPFYENRREDLYHLEWIR